MNINGANKNKIIALVMMLVLALGLMTSCGTAKLKDLKGDSYVCPIKVSFEKTDINQNDAKEIIGKQFEMLPKEQQNFIKEQGFEVIVTGSDISKYYKGQPKSLAGITDLESRIVCLEDKAVDKALHEFCHCVCYNEERNSSMYVKYPGVEKEQQKMNLGAYFNKDYKEYIVECMALYLQNQIKMEDYPITYASVKQMLTEREWKYGKE